MKKVALKQMSRNNKVKLVNIWTEDNIVYTEHGYLGGKRQIGTQIIEGKSVGKKNETTPMEQAVLEAERAIQKRRDAGFINFEDEFKEESNEFTFWPIPSEFQLSKPIGRGGSPAPCPRGRPRPHTPSPACGSPGSRAAPSRSLPSRHPWRRGSTAAGHPPRALPRAAPPLHPTAHR